MLYKIECIQTETWHQIMDDLKLLGFIETYQYEGIDAGIDYQRYDLLNPADGEVIVFEWDNWLEGEIKALPTRLQALREQYRLSAPVAVES